MVPGKQKKKAAQTNTPFTDGFLKKTDAPLPPGATPVVVGAGWGKGFGIAYGGGRKTIDCLSCNLATPANGGKPGDWAVKEMKLTADRQTVLEVLSLRLFKTNAEAGAFYKQEQKIPLANSGTERVRQAKADAVKPSENVKEEAKARINIMRESYPGTFKAMAAVSRAKTEDRPGAMESVFRAFLVDLVRLHKPADLDEFCAKGTGDLGLIIELAKAFKDPTPDNKIRAALAAEWAERFSKMKPEECAKIVNAATGSNLTPGAMKIRRLRMSLMSDRPEGAPEKSSNWDK